MKWLRNINLAKHYLSFILTMICVLGLFALAWFKDVDILSTLPIVLGTYVGARTVEKTVAVRSAASDPNADTRAVIKDVNGES
jgi:ABC-type proline/glycine betaine transport system permease subunit